MLVQFLIWTEKVRAEERMCRQVGPRSWKWFRWNKVRCRSCTFWYKPEVWSLICLGAEIGYGVGGACGLGRQSGKVMEEA